MINKRIGLRTIKTGLAVTISLLLSLLFDSEYSIFAAVAAILAMNKTISGTFETCREQIIGTVFGAVMGFIFIYLFPTNNAILTGIGIIIVIFFCNLMKIQIAIPLSCIVFCAVCLNSSATDNFSYIFIRLADTLIGLIIAVLINAFIKPYNNLPEIRKIILSIQDDIPQYVELKVINYHSPSLDPIHKKLKTLENEITIYENEIFKKHKRLKETALLNGCLQLLVRMTNELASIINLDSTPVPTKENLENLMSIGISIDENAVIGGKCPEEDNTVLNFHLKNLINCNNYLSTFMLESWKF